MVDVLQSIGKNNEITVINPPKNINDFNCVYTETQDQTLSVMSENEIYFHASEYETVGLPLYEAQNLGMKIIVPNKPYSKYFMGENVFLYKYNDKESAIDKIKQANYSKLKKSSALIYKENWLKILNYI